MGMKPRRREAARHAVRASASALTARSDGARPDHRAGRGFPQQGVILTGGGPPRSRMTSSGKWGPPQCGAMERVQDLLAACPLSGAGSPRPKHLDDGSPVIVDGEGDDVGERRSPPDPFGCSDAAAAWHADVEERHVRPGLAGHLHRVSSIDGPPRPTPDEGRPGPAWPASPGLGLIVRDEDAHPPRKRGFLSRKGSPCRPRLAVPALDGYDVPHDGPLRALVA